MNIYFVWYNDIIEMWSWCRAGSETAETELSCIKAVEAVVKQDHYKPYQIIMNIDPWEE